eukprot:1160279-Pelagomonas_calceolata.AAC.1
MRANTWPVVICQAIDHRERTLRFFKVRFPGIESGTSCNLATLERPWSGFALQCNTYEKAEPGM